MMSVQEPSNDVIEDCIHAFQIEDKRILHTSVTRISGLVEKMWITIIQFYVKWVIILLESYEKRNHKKYLSKIKSADLHFYIVIKCYINSIV